MACGGLREMYEEGKGRMDGVFGVTMESMERS